MSEINTPNEDEKRTEIVVEPKKSNLPSATSVVEFTSIMAGKIAFLEKGMPFLDKVIFHISEHGGKHIHKILPITTSATVAVTLFLCYEQMASSGKLISSSFEQSDINLQSIFEFGKEFEGDLFQRMPFLDSSIQKDISNMINTVSKNSLFVGDNITEVLQTIKYLDGISDYINLRVKTRSLLNNAKCVMYKSMVDDINMFMEGGGSDEPQKDKKQTPAVQLPLTTALKDDTITQAGIFLPTAAATGVGFILGIPLLSISLASCLYLLCVFCISEYVKYKKTNELAEGYINELYEQLKQIKEKQNSIVSDNPNLSSIYEKLIILPESANPTREEKLTAIYGFKDNYLNKPELLKNDIKNIQTILLLTTRKCNVKELINPKYYTRYEGEGKQIQIKNTSGNVVLNTTIPVNNTNTTNTTNKLKESIKQQLNIGDIDLQIENINEGDKNNPMILKKQKRMESNSRGDESPITEVGNSSGDESPITEVGDSSGDESQEGYLQENTIPYETIYILGDINYLSDKDNITLTIIPKIPVYQCIDEINYFMDVLDVYYYWKENKHTDDGLIQIIKNILKDTDTDAYRNFDCTDRKAVLKIERKLFNLVKYKYNAGRFRSALKRKQITNLFNYPGVTDKLTSEFKLLYIYSGLLELSRNSEPTEGISRERLEFINYKKSLSPELNREIEKISLELVSIFNGSELNTMLDFYDKQGKRIESIEKYIESWKFFITRYSGWHGLRSIALTTQRSDFLNLLKQKSGNFYTITSDELEKYRSIIEEIYIEYNINKGSIRKTRRKKHKTKKKKRKNNKTNRKKRKINRRTKKKKKTKRKSKRKTKRK
jgi:hypothetical protein